MLVTRSHILFGLLVAITGASAQSSNFSTCGQECLVTYVTDGTCRSMSVPLAVWRSCALSLTSFAFYSTNVTCLCTDTAVQTALGTCLQNCSSADVATAEALEKSLCSNSMHPPIGPVFPEFIRVT